MNCITNSLSRLRKLWVIPALLAISACATSPNSNVVQTMDNADFVRASAEDRAAYLNNVSAEDRLITQKRQAEYLAGRPVEYGNGRTGYTLQWNRIARMAYVYPGHTTGAMGMETSAMMAFATDAHGNTLSGNGGSPIVLMANVATQEGLGRVALGLGTQVVGAAVNGSIAAKINADGSCGENCMGDLTQISVESTATGTGNANSTAASGGSGCVTCGILD